ncbi:MAG TPA: DinB family protein [Candidatus Limnocylindrales bacterium]
MNDSMLRDDLAELLDGQGAHMPLEDAVADFPDDAINRQPPNVDYTPWHLLEHIRLTQLDILDYVRNRNYQARAWPAEYWPAPDAKATPAEFQATVDGCLADRAELRRMLVDPSMDLFAVIPGTPGHTLLREVRIAADHAAYHVGEFAVLRQVMGTWPAGRDD